MLLDLGAVWCHWCHVMEDHLPRSGGGRLLRSRYIAVQVDQDSRPDLSNRYEDYGWPATIVFDANGGEIVKRQGYIPPRPMASMLQAIIDDPTPGPSCPSRRKDRSGKQCLLASRERAGISKPFARRLRSEEPGLGNHPQVPGLERRRILHVGLSPRRNRRPCWSAWRGRRSARNATSSTRCGAAFINIQPTGTGSIPTTRNSCNFQAENLRIYAAAYARWGDPEYLKDAKQIRRYMKDFLTSPDGVFYTSQDADLVRGEHSEGVFRFE